MLSVLCALSAGAELHWYRGNLHTHTTESDGDSSPADVVRWYREHGYDFLVITDHNRVTAVQDDKLLLIPGEEVTDRFAKKPVHVNAIGVTRVVTPQHGDSIASTLQHDVDAVREAGGIAEVNHPNFGWAFGAGEMQQVNGFTLLEIASGHPHVNMQGGDGVEPVEAMWDELLRSGKRVYAVAVDDAHYFHCDVKVDEYSPPGKGWIVVRAEKLDRQALLDAIARGDFYASTGVMLDSIDFDGKELHVKVHQDGDAKYRTTIVRDEKYIRARVDDSNGHSAWTQPVFLKR
ncbi:MAG TPA: CehA/McbA family metallohydrolase [Thermoanaerobaculia bacterium]